MKEFRKIKPLGKGSYSEVFLAEDKVKWEIYAIKVIELGRILTNDKEKERLIGREYKILRTTDHPNIIKLHFKFNHKNKVCFGLEYAPNGELAKLLKLYKILPFPLAQYYIAELVNALEYLKSLNIAHRDIKPENILIDVNYHLKITDFGTSKFMDEVLDEPKEDGASFVGSNEYVSPEVLANKESSPASDLWALGCIIYKFIVGQSPFYRETPYLTLQAIAEVDFSFPSNMHEAAKDLCKKLLVADPSKRLGNGVKGFEELKAHPFFKGIDFNNLIKTKPPITDEIIERLSEEENKGNEIETSSDEDSVDAKSDIVDTNNKILKKGTVLKKCGLIFYRYRDLILYDKPRLVYFSSRTKDYKGDIILTKKVRAVKKAANRFDVVIPHRTYYFKAKSSADAKEWIKLINTAITNNK